MQSNEFQINQNFPCLPDDFNRIPQAKLNRILSFIERRLEGEIRLEDLAAEAKMSVFYFARMFKRSTGKSPHQFVLEQRIEYAKYLLTETDEPLVEIALRCGWANQSHFTTAFKQKAGVTPRRYRHWHEPVFSPERKLLEAL